MQINVPEEFAALAEEKRSYGHLYDFLASHFRSLPLALYRHPSSCKSVDW